MKDFRHVINDENKKKALYLLCNMRIKGFVVEHGVKGLFWFNTKERMKENKRDLLVSATDVKILL
ncbi:MULTISPECIES: hypothetical protein [Bacillus subtilis group]|uniref:hypothetical protein n=1 Tax=Bacillus subtilis group TaxID=653685 RepID=UPI000D046ABF|nr:MULTISPECIES: hypothetical protein [Bacillus subtilis group]MCY8285222.1 hypothetical protein [Bacillus inaquosorum]MCY9456661.1 hypothetical protein [Bacillus inaquosorum]PRR87418.1 hypothetical protein C6W23_18940 [Bacillus atrophaeus]